MTNAEQAKHPEATETESAHELARAWVDWNLREAGALLTELKGNPPATDAPDSAWLEYGTEIRNTAKRYLDYQRVRPYVIEDGGEADKLLEIYAQAERRRRRFEELNRH